MKKEILTRTYQHRKDREQCRPQGEVRATLYSPDSGNLKEGKVLLLKHAGKTAGNAGSGVRELEAKCTGVRLQKDRPVIKLEGITDKGHGR